MKNKLQGIIDRYNQLTEMLTQQEVITNKDQFKNISKEKFLSENPNELKMKLFKTYLSFKNLSNFY